MVSSCLKKTNVSLIRKVIGTRAFSCLKHEAGDAWRAKSPAEIRRFAKVFSVRSAILCRQVLWFRKQAKKEIESREPQQTLAVLLGSLVFNNKPIVVDGQLTPDAPPLLMNIVFG